MVVVVLSSPMMGQPAGAFSARVDRFVARFVDVAATNLDRAGPKPSNSYFVDTMVLVGNLTCIRDTTFPLSSRRSVLH